MENIVRNALIGCAIGDAFGVPYEFMSRKDVRSEKLNDMVGKNTKHPNSRWGDFIPAGAWSDDTSMLISSMDSIIKNNGSINYDDIMENFFNWWYKKQYNSLNFSFGLGTNVSVALNNYIHGIPALESGGKSFMDNGNGSLMRILPFSLYCIYHNLNTDDTVQIINNASSLTHGHDISKMCCYIYTEILKEAIKSKDTYKACKVIHNLQLDKYYSNEAIHSIGHLLDIEENDINETGYVVDTLKSVIYSLLHSHSYEETIKTAVYLGYDTDTVAAITGSIAGVIYGIENIPNKWLNKLKKKEELIILAEKYQKILEQTNYKK